MRNFDYLTWTHVREILERSNKHLVFVVSKDDQYAFEAFRRSTGSYQFCDEFESQLIDWVKLSNSSKALSMFELKELVKINFGADLSSDLGCWVYYPWKKTFVHILTRDLFVKVRTVRNYYKISPEQQTLLNNKKVGVVGLSVGQSVSLALALERVAGEIRIADFDTLELSNLNRLRTSLINLGLSKTQIVYREIAEIDPFINVVCFDSGVSSENIDEFIEDGGRLDLIIEECDSIDIKYLIRKRSKAKRIPVIMDTSDRGMLDIERYDLEPDYPLLHGLMNTEVSYEFLKSLKTSEEKLPYILPIVGLETMSSEMKASGLEVGTSITTWPQLASDVIVGGGVACNVSRRVLLGEDLRSGRYYVDPSELIPSRSHENEFSLPTEVALSELIIEESIKRYVSEEGIRLEVSELESLIEAACLATSPGNNQKWKFIEKKGSILIFVDRLIDENFADNFSFGAKIGIGAALENMRLWFAKRGYLAVMKVIEDNDLPSLSAVIRIISRDVERITDEDLNLFEVIERRNTNRSIPQMKDISSDLMIQLTNYLELEGAKIELLNDSTVVHRISELICQGDRIRLMNEAGHYDFFQNEIRWSTAEASQMKDGLDLELFELTSKDIAGIKLAKDSRAVRLLRDQKLGEGFQKFSQPLFNPHVILGVLKVPDYSNSSLINAGQLLQRFWLKTEVLGIAMHPMTVLQMLFSRLVSDRQGFMNDNEKREVQLIKSEFDKLANMEDEQQSVVLFRLFISSKNFRSSFRKELKSIYEQR